MRAKSLVFCVAAVACGAPTVAPEPDPLTVEVAARYVDTSCTIEWTATASAPLVTVSYSVGFGEIESPSWVEQGTFQGAVTVELAGPAPNNNVTFLLTADGYRRAANIGPSGVC